MPWVARPYGHRPIIELRPTLPTQIRHRIPPPPPAIRPALCDSAMPAEELVTTEKDADARITILNPKRTSEMIAVEVDQDEEKEQPLKSKPRILPPPPPKKIRERIAIEDGQDERKEQPSKTNPRLPLRRKSEPDAKKRSNNPLHQGLLCVGRAEHNRGHHAEHNRGHHCQDQILDHHCLDQTR